MPDLAQLSREKLIARSVPDSNGCWIWQGCIQQDRGYGLGVFFGKYQGAHRASYKAFVGEVASDQVVRHRCHIRRCVNPQHLTIGTQRDNIQDAMDADRHCKNERHGMAKLTMNKVRAIRAFLSNGVSQNRLARMFGVKQGTISFIKRGKTWKS